MCHMSRVMCHMSRVTCHMSHVTCPKEKKKREKKFGQSGGASRWRVCYQRGLPRLVFLTFGKFQVVSFPSKEGLPFSVTPPAISHLPIMAQPFPPHYYKGGLPTTLQPVSRLKTSYQQQVTILPPPSSSVLTRPLPVILFPLLSSPSPSCKFILFPPPTCPVNSFSVLPAPSVFSFSVPFLPVLHTPSLSSS